MIHSTILDFNFPGVSGNLTTFPNALTPSYMGSGLVGSGLFICEDAQIANKKKRVGKLHIFVRQVI